MYAGSLIDSLWTRGRFEDLVAQTLKGVKGVRNRCFSQARPGTLNSEGLAGDRLLQGGVEKRGAHSLFPRGDTEELANQGGAKDAQQQRLDLRMHFDSRQRNFPRGNCVMIIIANRQTCCVLRLRIDPQQDLVRELIAGGCSGLPKGNVEDISIGIVGNARCFHRFSPPVPKDLVSGHDKIVLGASRNKAATDNGDDRIVAGGQIFKVSVKVSGQKRSQVIAIG